MTDTSASKAHASAVAFQHALKRALVQRKSVVRPRLTFPQLAEAAGVSESTVKRMFDLKEDARPVVIDVTALWGLSQALGTSPDELVAQAARELDGEQVAVRAVKPTAKVSTKPTTPRRGKKSTRG